MKEEVFTAIGWERLRTEGRRSTSDLGIPSLELDVATGAGKVRLAIGAGGDAALLLPLGPGDAFPLVEETHSLELKDSVRTLRGRPTRFAEIVSRDPQLEKVFEKLAADIMRRLGDGVDTAVAVEDAVADFRSLLVAGRKLVTRESAAGLLGELILLNRLLAASPSAWETWMGPLEARHDFRNGDHAIEVKTSLRAQRRIVEIAAIDQLLEPDGGDLALAHYVIENNAGGQLNVADEADNALRAAGNPPELADRLAAVGYATELRDRWSGFRFSLLSSNFYAVRDGFPRLTPTSFKADMLAAGVSHVRYRLDLAAAADFELTPAELDAVLEGMIA